MGITFNGQVTINGPMFDIHDNQHVETHIHYTERGENETDANGETNENGPTGSASARPAKPAEPATFPATALDEIFHPALNVDSVKSALWDILGQKGEAGKGQMKSLKHWFIIHKVLEEIDWLTRTRVLSSGWNRCSGGLGTPATLSPCSPLSRKSIRQRGTPIPAMTATRDGSIAHWPVTSERRLSPSRPQAR